MPEASFVLSFDPVIGQVSGLYLWWYGASYTLGFLGAFLWLRRERESLGLSAGDVYALTILLASGVIMGGRVVEVIFYEWEYYGDHLVHVPALWLGGMSTHGIMLGAVLAVWWFCRRRGRSFLVVADGLAIAGAYIMGMGRIGNFIDGQIAGSVTDVWWAVKFPDLEGFRHPVVLYDGVKNLLLVPVLICLRRLDPPPGTLLGCFLFGYGFLRIFVDLFREYRTDFFGFPPGQEFNVAMSLAGLALVFRALWANRLQDTVERPLSIGESPAGDPGATFRQRCALVALLALPLVIPSDWTQDVPSRYGSRHEGIEYSVLYPRLSEADAQE